MSYLTTKINFENIDTKIQAAKSLEQAGESDQAKQILVKMAEEIKKEMK